MSRFRWPSQSFIIALVLGLLLVWVFEYVWRVWLLFSVLHIQVPSLVAVVINTLFLWMVVPPIERRLKQWSTK